MALEDFFTWGSGGRKMTPDQLAAERQALAVMQAREGDTSPVAHWSQGLGRVVNALAGNYRESKADKAEAAGIAQGQAAMDPVLAALMGGGSGGGYTAGGGASGGTWTPAPPPPSATATPGMEGGLGFGASVPAMPAPSAGGLSFGAQPMTPQQMIIAGAEARGLDPIDVATAISYETGGKFDPLISGPTTQWGTHRGLIQFGEPQALQYGADFSSPEAAMKSQLDPETGAVWNYLDGVGVQPGMGLDNIYSAINAGAPGRFNASDANNGGAPGTVADKVAGMGGHRQKASEFLGGTWTPNPDAGGGNPVTMSTSGQPAAPQGDILGLLMAAQADPWARKQYGPVIDALMGSELSTRAQAQDPMYQLGLQKAQMEVDAMRNPAAPKPIEVGGVLLDPNTFQPIFDSRTTAAPAPIEVNGQLIDPRTGAVIGDYRTADAPDPFAGTKLIGDSLVAPDGQGGFAPVYTPPAAPGYVTLTPAEVASRGLPPGAYQRGPDDKIYEIGGGGVNVTVGGEPGLGKLSTDYGYVLDANGKPVIDQATGLPKAAPVPGSPAAIEAAKLVTAGDIKGGNKETATDVITNAAKYAREADKSRMVGGWAGEIAAKNPGSQNAEVYRQVSALRANASAENIAAMRASSPTGAALGGVSDRDIQLLADKSGALNPASPNFARDLDDYERTVLRLVHGKEAGDRIFEATREGEDKPEPSPLSVKRRRWNPEKGAFE